jgi:hypothetical protein
MSLIPLFDKGKKYQEHQLSGVNGFTAPTLRLTARAVCKSQEKAPSAVDVAAARAALTARRLVMEGRLMRLI